MRLMRASRGRMGDRRSSPTPTTMRRGPLPVVPFLDNLDLLLWSRVTDGPSGNGRQDWTASSSPSDEAFRSQAQSRSTDKTTARGANGKEVRRRIEAREV